MTLAASVAQLAEQRFCKPPVVGSNPSAGFTDSRQAAESAPVAKPAGAARTAKDRVCSREVIARSQLG